MVKQQRGGVDVLIAAMLTIEVSGDDEVIVL